MAVLWWACDNLTVEAKGGKNQSTDDHLHPLIMCGIFAIINDDTDQGTDSLATTLRKIISRRGPDYHSPLVSRQTKCGVKLKLVASILHLRGDKLQKQPVEDTGGNLLLFNGQIYTLYGHELDTTKSDTLSLLEELSQAKTEIQVATIFANIDGPFAFIYWKESSSSLFYGRDLFGRKSLCSIQAFNEDYPSVISSVAPCDFEKDAYSKWSEVDSRGVHCLDFSTYPNKPIYKKFLYNMDLIYPISPKCQAKSETPTLEEYLKVHSYLKPLNQDTRTPESFPPGLIETACDRLNQKILESVAKRIRYNRQDCLICRKKTQMEENVGLNRCNHTKVAVAFSGGLDSTVLALAIDKALDKDEIIDLLTVAFKEDSPDRTSVACAYEEIRKLSPTRCWRLVLTDVTKDQLHEARIDRIRDLISPCKTVVDDSLGCACWFISKGEGRAIDSTLDDNTFADIFPKFVPYDIDFIRSTYSTISDHILTKYQSPASMIFAGSAIDEQLGGYSSHREAWKSKGPEGCYEEILFQMRRLPSRNLGRDDRVYSDHGRDLKIPYLDFSLVSYLNDLPVALKMNLDECMDTGPKKILRLLAMSWGLNKTSKQVKRALQFGSRIAKLESSKERGNDICDRL